jgi:hypothetical protein
LAPKTLGYRITRGNWLARLDNYDEAAKNFAAAMPRGVNSGFKAADLRMYAYLGARDLYAHRHLLRRFSKLAPRSRARKERAQPLLNALSKVRKRLRPLGTFKSDSNSVITELSTGYENALSR